MADMFRRELDCGCDIGGVHCECCNSYHGKEKPVLNRLARTRLKQRDRKEFKKELDKY